MNEALFTSKRQAKQEADDFQKRYEAFEKMLVDEEEARLTPEQQAMNTPENLRWREIASYALQLGIRKRKHEEMMARIRRDRQIEALTAQSV